MKVLLFLLGCFSLSQEAFAYSKLQCREILVRDLGRSESDAYQNCGNNETFNFCIVDMTRKGHKPSEGYNNCSSNPDHNRCLFNKMREGLTPNAAYQQC
jgi:hypothetical protein